MNSPLPAAVELSDPLAGIGAPPNRLFHRIAWLGLLLAAEWVPISAWVHPGRGGNSLVAGLAAFLCFLVTFGYFRVRDRVPAISLKLSGTHPGWLFLAAHIVSLAVFLRLSFVPTANVGGPEPLLLACWYGSGLIAAVLALFVFVPPRYCFDLLRATGYIWIFAAIAALLAWRFVPAMRSAWNSSLWRPATDATFSFTKFLLQPFLADVVLDRAHLIIGSSRFSVRIGAACSGFEGAGLMLVFSLGWLWFFRRECRFPQALFLVPASIAVMWLLNAVRIAVLVLIGNAGFPAIAVGGFHSQAGWISFNLVALGVSLAATRIPWWKNRQAEPLPPSKLVDNPTAVYLLPFLGILAAAMVSRAVSDGFEWLYPLRLIAAAAVFWLFRAKYAALNWRLSWFAPIIGAVVFLLWMSLEPTTHPDNGMASHLAAYPTAARLAWLICRTLAAVVTVPLAEELAFRGFLIRRLMSADFASLDFGSYTYIAILLSSLAFGLMHGDRWIAGTVAGVLYALVFLRRGSLGDAALAHATTNALIAATVLTQGKWYLW
jgi:exosortase E/protease (VPEID-CTERM system)